MFCCFFVYCFWFPLFRTVPNLARLFLFFYLKSFSILFPIRYSSFIVFSPSVSSVTIPTASCTSGSNGVPTASISCTPFAVNTSLNCFNTSSTPCLYASSSVFALTAFSRLSITGKSDVTMSDIRLLYKPSLSFELSLLLLFFLHFCFLLTFLSS